VCIVTAQRRAPPDTLANESTAMRTSVRSLRYVEFPPPAPLADAVECTWALWCETAMPISLRLVPDARVELLIQRAGIWSLAPDQAVPLCAIVGPLSRPIDLRADGAFETLGIRFRTAGAPCALRGDLSRWTDRVVSVADVSARLRLRLIDAGSTPLSAAEHLTRITSALSDARRREPDTLVAGLLAADRASWDSLDALAECQGISARTLQRRVQAATGLRPGLLRRLWRFRDALPCLARHDRLGHAALAQQAGYYDHAHFIRDVRQFTGMPPAAFLRTFEILSSRWDPSSRLGPLPKALAGSFADTVGSPRRRFA